MDERVGEVNHDLHRADGSTRWERFTDEEQSLLGMAPATRFEEVTWKELKAGRNYHLSCNSQRYSVPYRLAGGLLRVRLTSTRVTIFDGHDLGCRLSRTAIHRTRKETAALPVPSEVGRVCPIRAGSLCLSRYQRLRSVWARETEKVPGMSDLKVGPIQVPDDWNDSGILLFEEFCTFIHTPQRTVRDWKQRRIGPRWWKFNGNGRLYTTVGELRRFLTPVGGGDDR